MVISVEPDAATEGRLLIVEEHVAVVAGGHDTLPLAGPRPVTRRRR
jgi:hypothetical protein